LLTKYGIYFQLQSHLSCLNFDTEQKSEIQYEILSVVDWRPMSSQNIP